MYKSNIIAKKYIDIRKREQVLFSIQISNVNELKE